MGYYSKLIESFDNYKNTLIDEYKSSPTTNNNVSSLIAGELTIIISVLVTAIMLRSVNIMLSVGIIIILAVLLITNMPLMPKIMREHEDSLDMMMFYVVLVLAILVTIIYWGILQ
ncbi:MAG: energy-converting hydrogenase B subunit G EhbG [Methanobrevibacter sp.]|jgi:energy-converting hydrogenase B subunit G|nr:energy-converting hydrogenase B subunit G EhbG [Candidatus Methanoflexus mossambicus]